MTRDLKEKLFEIDSKKIELDFLQQQFLVESKRFIAQNMERCARNAVSSNPQKALSLGKEGLAPVKTKIEELTNNVSDMVDSQINREALWHHHQEDLRTDNFKPDAYACEDGQYPADIKEALILLLSPVGKILMDHDLDGDQNWKNTGETVKYLGSPAWTKEMVRCITEYSDRFSELSRLVAEYEILTQQSAGNDALDLWDSI